MDAATYSPAENLTTVVSGTTTIELEGKWTGILTTQSGRRAINRIKAKALYSSRGLIALPGETVKWVLIAGF